MTKIVAPRRDEALVSERGNPNLRFANTIEELVRGFNALTFNADEVVAIEDAYIEFNVTERRTFDADTVTVEELADVVGTLIADLKKVGILP